MIYLIDWVEVKTSKTGKEYKQCTLKTEAGFTFDKVSVWPDFLDYTNVRAGSKVEGDIATKGQYRNLVGGRSLASAPRAPSGIVRSAEITRDSVREAQQSKNASIAFFNATNSAIAILGVMGKSGLFDDMVGGRTQEAQAIIRDWREWFLGEWRNYEAGDITDKTKPF